MTGNRCTATTARGFRCINRATPGKLTCPGHDPALQCGAPTVAGKLCRRMRSYGTERCSKHQGVTALPL
ncbi:hypothetical protein SEA_MISCHIEF19_76 [Streptomyces phage Mischief19]|nr:hypothetical protein SEA_MISCHIEF19_76 [Streptomyces phage Mischief19]